MTGAYDSEAQKTMENPQTQNIDRIVDVPVRMQRQVPTIQRAHETMSSSQEQHIDQVPCCSARQVRG